MFTIPGRLQAYWRHENFINRGEGTKGNLNTWGFVEFREKRQARTLLTGGGLLTKGGGYVAEEAGLVRALDAVVQLAWEVARARDAGSVR